MNVLKMLNEVLIIWFSRKTLSTFVIIKEEKKKIVHIQTGCYFSFK